jgi:hypothetical protein
MSSTSTEENKEEKENQTNEEYEILSEEYPQYDLSFKIIVIGNSGKKILI